MFTSIPDVNTMNDTMKSNWNAVVQPHDTVYFLGDFAFADQEKVRELLEELNGNIYLCRGNHDKPLNNFHKYFVDVFDLRTIKVADPDGKDSKYQHIALCHYPLHSWDKQFHNSWHLHGHCHGKVPFDPKLKRLDVGVDAHNFTPISYEQVKTIFKTGVLKHPIIELE